MTLLSPSPLSSPCSSFPTVFAPQPLELAARLNRKELFYHIIFKNREICWQYGSRVNYNLDLRVVDGAPPSTNLDRWCMFYRF